MHPYDYDALVKISLAALLGAIIGFEREKSRKPAGIRTQMLICVGSALLASVSIHLGDHLGVPNADPARLMAQIVSGIGFLGAGVIIKESSSQHITGVTTAATIWMTSAIGIAVGAGFMWESALCTALVLLLHPIQKMKYLTGVTTEIFTLSIDNTRWQEVSDLLVAAKIHPEILQMAGNRTRIRFRVARAKGRRFTVSLHDLRVPFEVIDYDYSGPTLFG